MCFWIFDTISNKRLIKIKINIKTFKAKANKQTNNFQLKLAPSTQPSIVTKTLEVLMHEHVVMLMLSTPLHPHVTCIWGDILIGLGMRVRTFKPSSEAF